ncbi:MAG: hypothetical protein ACJ744_02280 [Gaiellaceae bacterium]|jgi:FlaG/FlaF family flagellin (archaellin)
MQRSMLALTAALVALAAATAGTAVAKQQPANVKKTNICHFTGKKYVAITVSTKAAMQTHVQHHQDMIGAPVPQGTTKSKTAAARAFCAKLPVLTATHGGNPLSAKLTSTTAGLSGSIDTAARVGQGQICLKLSITSTTTPITVSGIKILQATTTLAALDLSTVTSLTSTTSPLQVSGCVNLNRSLVKQLLQTPGLTIQVATSSPTGGLLTGTLS